MTVDRPVVVSVRTAELGAADRAAIVELCTAAHDHAGFAHLFDLLPADALHVLAELNDRTVGHAVVSERWAQPEHSSSPLRTGFVDAVSVEPSVQRRGLGSAVMRRVASELERFELGCLQTDNAAPFYERLGWLMWRGPLAGRRGDVLVPTPEQDGVMVLETSSTPSLELDALLTIECQPTRIWD